tara:strand:+ start:1573 stop:1686 length:114 start_codon:yes stop_codon:yes gene_type:complete
MLSEKIEGKPRFSTPELQEKNKNSSISKIVLKNIFKY